MGKHHYPYELSVNYFFSAEAYHIGFGNYMNGAVFYLWTVYGYESVFSGFWSLRTWERFCLWQKFVKSHFYPPTLIFGRPWKNLPFAHTFILSQFLSYVNSFNINVTFFSDKKKGGFFALIVWFIKTVQCFIKHKDRKIQNRFLTISGK